MSELRNLWTQIRCGSWIAMLWTLGVVLAVIGVVAILVALVSEW